MPIDRLLEAAEYGPTDRGYEIRLPSGDTYWRFANRFIEEEAACCASFGFGVRDERDATIIRAAHGGIPS